MLTVAVNAPATAGATESTVFGPFFVEDAPEVRARRRHCPRRDGQPVLHVSGTRALRRWRRRSPGARIEVWEADEDGFYDVQYDDDRSAAPGLALHAGADGEYRFWSVLARALSDSRRRTGRRSAASRRPQPDAARAPALQGRRPGATAP